MRRAASHRPGESPPSGAVHYNRGYGWTQYSASWTTVQWNPELVRWPLRGFRDIPAVHTSWSRTLTLILTATLTLTPSLAPEPKPQTLSFAAHSPA